MTRQVDHLIVHASATEHGKEFTAADIDKWHRARGWLGNGYHFVILLDGTVQSHANGHRCRPVDKPGAHVGDCGRGWNRRSIGVCLIGGLTRGKPSDKYTEAQYESLFNLLEELAHIYDVPTDNIMGHRDLIALTNASPKACPCFDVKEWITEMDRARTLSFAGVSPFNENFNR